MNLILYIGLDVHNDSIAVSIPRELSGFVWAIAQQFKPHPPKAKKEEAFNKKKPDQ